PPTAAGVCPTCTSSGPAPSRGAGCRWSCSAPGSSPNASPSRWAGVTERPRRDDLRACRAIIHAHARSFSFACRFLPARVRDDVAVVYAYYRLLDDLVDVSAPGTTRDDLLGVLDDWDAWLAAGAPADDSHPVRRALPGVIER